MIRTQQEFVNEVRARFSERLSDEIEEHGRTVMHFAEENNRLRAELADKTRNYEDVITHHKRREEHLRDLVKRLARVAQDTLYFAEAISGIVPDNPERAKARGEIESLLREAREAIGEDRP